MTVSELQVVVSADVSKAESGLAALGSKVGGVGSAIGTAFGAAAVGGIVALGAGLTAAVGAAASFESAMSAIKAVSGATSGEMEQLRGKALDLGAATSFSASEAASGIEELLKAGVSVGDVMGGGAAAALNLAAAGAVSVGEAATITSDAMNMFGLSGEKATHVADLLAGASVASSADVHGLGQGLAAVGAVANTVGLSLDDTTTALALMAQAGVKGSDAGTSLKTMLLNLTPSTKAQISVAKELGIITADGANRFFDATGKAKGMSEVAQVLQDSMQGLTKQQQLQALATLFGTDAIRAASIMATAGAEGYDKMAAAEAKIGADEVAKTRLDNLKGSLEQLKGSLETAGIELGTMLLPGLKSMADGLTEWVNKGIEIIKQLPGAWADVVTIFSEGSTKGNLESLLDQLGLSEATVVKADEWLGRIGDSWRTMQQALSGNWSPSDQIDPLVNAAGRAATAVRDLGITISDAIAKASAMGAWDNIATGFSNLGDAAGIASDRIDDIGAALARARGPAGQVATAADILAAAIKGAGLGFQYASMLVDDFIDGVGSSIAVVIDFTTGLSRISDALNKLKQGDLPGAVTALGEAKDAFGAGAVAAEDFRQRGLLATSDEAKTLAAMMNIHMTATKAAVESNMSAATAAVSEGSAGMAQFMEANGATMATATETSMQGVTAATESGMAGAVAAVETQGPVAVAAAETMGTGMAAGIEAAAPAMAAAAESGASGAVAAVQGQEGAASAAGSSVGDSMGSGMQSGILGWVGRIASAAANLVSSALGAARAEAAAQSPSKKTERLGEDLAEGLEIGLNKSKLGPEMQARIRDFIQASRDYIPVAGQIKRVEGEIKDIRDRSQTDALFRSQQMITIDSESLRLKQASVALERDLLPLRQDLARATREVSDIERGSLGDRTNLIEMDGQRKTLRLQEIDLEKQLIGLDSGSKRAKTIQEQIDKLRDQDRALGLEGERITLTNSIAATAAKVRREGLDDTAKGQQTVIDRINDQIAVLASEQTVFQANENVIKNATQNEIDYRSRLIAVFTSEGKPLADRVTAGLLLVDQLEKEGKISKELATQLRDVARDAGISTEKTTGLGKAADTATPLLDAAGKKAQEMAAGAQAIAEQAKAGAKQVDALSSSLGKLPDWFRPKVDPIFKPRAEGGPVTSGMPYLVGERGPELFMPGRSGTILPSMPGGYGGGDAITIDLRGAQVYDGSKFEDLMVRALDRAQRGGRIVQVTR